MSKLTYEDLIALDSKPVWSIYGHCFIINALQQYGVDKWRGYRMLPDLVEMGVYRTPEEAAAAAQARAEERFDQEYAEEAEIRIHSGTCGTTGLACIRCNPGPCDHRIGGY